ncbi:FHA domain-containing protein [Clostridium sp. DJ247]|uniref:FHA domain-containing protein n=1 Tax=Clostridium sp. DJ247 TaxID=2726188 RepID=UPI0016263A62|nr:FHA domain-containing protein [Clostridium sp. DJ247]MBC2580535.1 FHA domain-containing protein [Clostridium sp. DJ247]
MWKIPDHLNIVSNIKKYIAIKKLEKYSKGTNEEFGIILLDIAIIIAVITAFYYIYFINTNHILKITIGILVVAFIVAYMIKITSYVMNYKTEYEGITTLILIDGKGNYEAEWDIKDKQALVIGKNTRNNEVDIDLSNTEYASLISKQHAVLNFAANSWFIEDIGSCNGVGIKKVNETSKKKLKRDTPCKLDSGDIIYIVNTKLFVK